MLVLGLGGKPHSGKTLSAETILARHPGTKLYSISDMICEELGVVRSEVKDPRILQNHGTLRRSQDELYWINRVIEAIDRDRAPLAVITNVRMLTEVAGVRKFGGYLIRYTRLDVDGGPWITNDRDMAHVLETALDDFNWDFYITVKHGQQSLLQLQTLTLVGYLQETHGKPAVKP